MATTTIPGTPSRRQSKIDRQPFSIRAFTFLVIVGIFLASYQTIRPTEYLITYSDLVFLGAAIILVFTRGAPLYYFGSLTPVWHLSFTLMIGALFISSIINNAEMKWFPIALQYSVCYILMPMLLFTHSQTVWRKYAIALVVGVIVMELIAFGIFLSFGGNFENLSFLGKRFFSGSGRWGAFISNPNLHAAVICMTLPVLYFLRTKRLVGANSFYASFAILFAALIFTASNTGFITAVIGTSVFILASGIRFRIRHFIVGLIAITTLVVFEAPLPQAFENRVVEAIETQDLSAAGTYSDRLDLIKEAWVFARSNNLFGVGADRYREISVHKAPVHNSYLLLWNEGGLGAMLGWVGMMTVMVMIALSNGRRYKLETALALSVLTAFLIFSLASTHMYARIWMLPVTLALMPTLIVRRQ